MPVEHPVTSTAFDMAFEASAIAPAYALRPATARRWSSRFGSEVLRAWPSGGQAGGLEDVTQLTAVAESLDEVVVPPLVRDHRHSRQARQALGVARVFLVGLRIVDLVGRARAPLARQCFAQVHPARVWPTQRGEVLEVTWPALVADRIQPLPVEDRLR